MLLPYDRLQFEARGDVALFARYLRDKRQAIGPYVEWLREVEQLARLHGYDPLILWFIGDYETNGFRNRNWTEGNTTGLAGVESLHDLYREDDPQFPVLAAHGHCALVRCANGRAQLGAVYNGVRRGFIRPALLEMLEQNKDPRYPRVSRIDDLCLPYTDSNGVRKVPFFKPRTWANEIVKLALDSGLPVPSQRYLHERVYWPESEHKSVWVVEADHVYEGANRSNNRPLSAVRMNDRLTLIGQIQGHANFGNSLWYLTLYPEQGCIHSDSVRFVE